MSKPPKVKIDGMAITENHYDDGHSRWSAIKLIEHSKQYKPFDFPLATFRLGTTAWSSPMSYYSFLYHVQRINNADLDYPILLDDEGHICDGVHRCLKAILEGRSTIKAIRLETMPSSDGPSNQKDE